MESGLDDLIAKLESLSREGLREAERKALSAVGDLFIEALSEAAPQHAQGPATKELSGGLPLKPGELKASFRKQVHVPTDAAIVNSDNEKTGEYVVIKPEGPAYHVAEWLEYGHAGPHTDSKATPPHPFIRETQDVNMSKAQELFVKVMTEEIARILND